MRYAYPCNLEPEEEEGFEGAFTVSFPDIPGALTCGYDRGEALENAEEVLELGPVDIQMFQLLQKDDESGHHGQGQG